MRLMSVWATAIKPAKTAVITPTQVTTVKAADDTPARLYELYDGAVARARARIDAAVAAHGLDMAVAAHNDDGAHASLRRLLCDMIEEYGRHTGQADLIREAVDGRTGEDPPEGWRP